MLHVTNGDSAQKRIEAAGLPGETLAWNDVLHEGPVPAGLSLNELSRVRAEYIAAAGWEEYEAVRAGFTARDAALERHVEGSHIVLWFEHDLYDQLQLLQLLAFFGGQTTTSPLELICIDRCPGVEHFTGLGGLSPEQIAALWEQRQPVSAEQLTLGSKAWNAFRSPDPSDLYTLLQSDTTALPFLGAALLRYFEEFPSTRNGLSRTEQQILDTLGTKPLTGIDLFRVCQQLEPAPFMGDLVFWHTLRRLCQMPHPLARSVDYDPMRLTYPVIAGQHFARTHLGGEVASGIADAIQLNGIDRWYGGAHLTNDGQMWRWDSEARRLVPPAL